VLKPCYRIAWKLADGTPLNQDAYEELNLLAHAEMAEIVLPQACGGQAECGTCRVVIDAGEVTPAVGDESRLIARHASRFSNGERLGCRVRPLSNLVVTVPGQKPRDLRPQ